MSGITGSTPAECLLAKLGDPIPSKGTNSSKTERLIRLIEACGVEMVILDELQHVHDRGQSPTIYKVADWIKNLVDRISRPVILVGLPRARVLVDTNEQLRRRFGASLALDRMNLDTDSNVTEFVELASGLVDALPVQCNLDLTSDTDIERLYYASDGRIGHIVSLLYRALMLVFHSKGRVIDKAVLERAFFEQIWRSGIGSLNPFREEFCFRRLEKRGEPFNTDHITRGIRSRNLHQGVEA